MSLPSRSSRSNIDSAALTLLHHHTTAARQEAASRGALEQELAIKDRELSQLVSDLHTTQAQLSDLRQVGRTPTTSKYDGVGLAPRVAAHVPLICGVSVSLMCSRMPMPPRPRAVVNWRWAGSAVATRSSLCRAAVG